MGNASFHFESRSIGKLLKDGRLVVPPNQRSYAWDDTHVGDLLRDLNQAIDDDEDEYFLGTVVLVQKSNTDASIADGQQRLATTTILLSRIRDKLWELHRDGSASTMDREFIRSMDRDTEQIIPHLSLNLEDNEFFVGTVIASPKDAKYAPMEAKRPSNRRLAKASATIDEYMGEVLKTVKAEAQADKLLKWVAFIEKRAIIGVVTVGDEGGAFRIFETLNDRGLKASQADILKNYFLSKAGNRFAEANALWQAIAAQIESIGEDEGEGLVTFIRHLWVTGHGPTKERELADRIRAEVTGQSKTLAFLTQADSAAATYVALSSSNHPKWSAYPSSVARNIGIIQNDLRVKQIKPLLFAVALHFEPKEAEKAFHLMVSWSVRFLVYGGRGGMLDDQYSRRAAEVGNNTITKARELRSTMEKYVPGDKEFEDAFAVARVSRNFIARYYLREIEKARQGKSGEWIPNDDHYVVNLEHVLPLNPGAGWGVDAETGESAQSLLGNMALLTAEENAKIGNTSFDDKKATLAKSSYLTTQEIAKNEKWAIPEIKARQAELAKTAVQVWSLKFAD